MNQASRTAATHPVGDAFAHPRKASHRGRATASAPKANASRSSEVEGGDEANLSDIYRRYPAARPEENPALALRIMLLLAWLMLLLLALLDQLGVSIDLRHATEPAPAVKTVAAPPTVTAQRVSSALFC
jgi:hypothetical protein